jgi:predicted lipoprotein
MVKVAGSSRSWALLGALAAFAAAPPIGCMPDPGTGDGGGIYADTAVAATAEDVLAQVGPGVIAPALARARADHGALRGALDAWAAAPTDAAAQAEAQAAFAAALGAWQALEPMQVGPAGSSLTVAGGEDRRDAIYSWPSINPCRVDQVTAEGDYAAPDFFTANLVHVYGYDTLEHLLWAGPDNVCPGQVAINADGTWDALGAAGVAERRAAYAQVVAEGIDAQLAALEAAWGPDGAWSAALAGGPGTPYADTQSALNAVFVALFYLETTAKDRKLLQPLGGKDCGAEACPEDLEALPSGLGATFLAANLRGFRALFTGGDGVGLDDLLTELGHGDLAAKILADTDAALALADAIDTPLVTLLETDRAQVQALHDAVKAVCDDLKGDLATVLSLQVPADAAGDND